MNIEMSKREELSDAELDGVNGGGIGETLRAIPWYVDAAREAVVKVIHDVAQGIADATTA